MITISESDSHRDSPVRKRRFGAPGRLWLRSIFPFLLFFHSANAQEERTGKESDGTGGSGRHDRIVEEGVAIEWSVEPVSGQTGRALMVGDDVVVRFRITDDNTGAPVRSANPAAWMDLLAPGEEPNPERRFQKASAFIQGNLFSQAEVDLNVYHVLTLNDDGTITVVDPLFGFGTTKMLALPQLASPGEDWMLTRDRRHLFVSLPASMQCAVVNTSSWEVDGTIHTGLRPRRLGLQPDEQYLWIANLGSGTEAGDAGVTAVTRSSLQTKVHIPTGADPVDIAFSDDSRYAFVANGADGTVSVIDVPSLRAIHHPRVGRSVTSIAYSELAGLVYAIDGKSGRIAGIEPEKGRLEVELQSKPGLSDIQFEPGGRFALIPNPEEDVVLVLDASTREIAHTVALEGRPSRVAFSDLMAYVSHDLGTDVSMMPIAQLDQAGATPSFGSFPAGQSPAGKISAGAMASGIAVAPGGAAVLVANPEDKLVYFYQEGMAAPMGSFTNYSRKPKAVLVVDRSLQERTEPGVYETTVRLQKPGTYETIFYLDAPRRVHAFAFDVAENPNLIRKRNEGHVDISVAYDRKKTLRAKEPFPVLFRIVDRSTQKPVSDLNDLMMLVFKAPGDWQERSMAKPTDDEPGCYGISVTPPEAGVYRFHLRSPTIGLEFSNNRPLSITVGPAIPQPGKTAAP